MVRLMIEQATNTSGELEIPWVPDGPFPQTHEISLSRQQSCGTNSHALDARTLNSKSLSSPPHEQSAMMFSSMEQWSGEVKTLTGGMLSFPVSLSACPVEPEQGPSGLTTTSRNNAQKEPAFTNKKVPDAAVLLLSAVGWAGKR